MDRIQIKGTPFWQIKNQNGYFLTMGEHILTPIFNTEEELDDYTINHHWDITCVLILLLIEHHKKAGITETPYETESL